MNDRKLFDFVIWLFAGLCLLVLLTSCNPYTSAGRLLISDEGGTATPLPTATMAIVTAPPLPTLRPVYVVAVDALEIRTGPSEARPNTGYLVRGDRAEVYATAQAEQEHCTTWAAIDPSLTRWVCFKFLTGE